MTENTYPRDFEIYWESHKADLIRQAPRALKEERENNGKMNTAGDWLLFALPIIVTSASLIPISSRASC